MAPLLQLCLLWRCGTEEGTVNAERGRILGGHCVGLNHVVGRGLPLSYIHNSEFTTKETRSTFPHETCTRGHFSRRQPSPPKRRGSRYSLATPWMMECQEDGCSQHQVSDIREPQAQDLLIQHKRIPKNHGIQSKNSAAFYLSQWKM